MWPGLSKEPRQQRDQNGADESDAASGHELLHALALCARVVIAVSFQKVDHTPNAETGPKGYHEGLEDAYSGREECHNENW